MGAHLLPGLGLELLGSLQHGLADDVQHRSDELGVVLDIVRIALI